MSIRGKLLTALAHVNTIGNSRTTAIHSLPPEILARIFIANMPTFQTQASESLEASAQECASILRFETKRGWSAFDLSAVCRYWRAVAIDLPTLWTLFPFKSPREGGSVKSRQPAIERGLELAKLLLERSRDVPLDLVIQKQDKKTNRRIYECFAGNEPQIRSLMMSDLTCDGSGRSRPLDRWNVPNLQALVLHATRSQSNSFVANFDKPRPSLSYLELRSVPQWMGHGVGNLTTLVLRSDSSASMSYAQFFDFLASTPLLQRLHITAAGPMEYDVAPSLRVHLSRLTEVCIRQPPPLFTARFLMSVQPSPHASLLLQDLGWKINQQDITTTFGALAQLEEFQNVHVVRFLHTEGRSDHNSRLDVTFASETLTITLTFTDSDMLFARTSQAFCALLDSCEITDLWCGLGDAFFLGNVGVLIRDHMPHLTTLGFYGSTEGFDSMTMNLVSGMRDVLVRLIDPALRVPTRDVSWISQALGGDPRFVPHLKEVRVAATRDGSPFNLTVVQRYLEERKSAGYQVSRLLLQRCEAYQRLIPMLRALVGEVEVADESVFASCRHLKLDDIHSTLYHS